MVDKLFGMNIYMHPLACIRKKGDKGSLPFLCINLQFEIQKISFTVLNSVNISRFVFR